MVQLVTIQGDQRGYPVERLRDARHLVEFRGPELLHKTRDLLGQPGGGLRHLVGDDPVLLLEVRIVDPPVEAAALQRVMKLPGTVGRDDDNRRRSRTNCSELGNGHLVVGQQLE